MLPLLCWQKDATTPSSVSCRFVLSPYCAVLPRTPRRQKDDGRKFLEDRHFRSAAAPLCPRDYSSHRFVEGAASPDPGCIMGMMHSLRATSSKDLLSKHGSCCRAVEKEARVSRTRACRLGNNLVPSGRAGSELPEPRESFGCVENFLRGGPNESRVQRSRIQLKVRHGYKKY